MKRILTSLMALVVSFTMTSIINPNLAFAQTDCVANYVWYKGECRRKCCDSVGASQCTDDEQCWHGKFCLAKTEAKKWRAKHKRAATAEELEQAKADKAKAEAEKKKAEETAKKADAARLKAEGERDTALADKAKAEEEKKKAEKEKKKAEKEKKKAEKEKKKAEKEKEKAEKENKKAIKNAASRGIFDANLYVIWNLAGVKKGYDENTALMSGIATFGWHPRLLKWFTIGPELGFGGQNLPATSESRAWNFFIGGTAIVSPVKWLDIKCGYGYNGVSPSDRQDYEGTDSQGLLLVGLMARIKKMSAGAMLMHSNGVDILGLSNTTGLGISVSGSWGGN